MKVSKENRIALKASHAGGHEEEIEEVDDGSHP
jgi:hypothetical protein